MKLLQGKQWYVKYVYMIIGTALMSIAINSIYDVKELVTGGFTGISIMIKNISEDLFGRQIPIWISNLVLNIPLFLVGRKVKGNEYIRKSFCSMVLLSLWLYLIPPLSVLQIDDIILSAIFGGLLNGLGLGLVFLSHATTGGTDLLAAVIQHFKKEYSIVSIMMAIDCVIVFLGAFLFGLTKALYAIIAIFVSTKITDAIVEGGKFSKMVYIITEKEEEIAAFILKDISRGATGIYGKGMYSGKNRTMLFCVVSKKELVMLKERIMEVDPKAFIIIGDAKEVWGEGFISEQSKNI